MARQIVSDRGAASLGRLVIMAMGFLAPAALAGQQVLAQAGGSAPSGATVNREVTFAADVAPILRENCEACHREGGVGPMAFSTYEQVRPWAPLIMDRTGRRDTMGAMPPYYLEREIGIQDMKDDVRLTEEEIETIAAWVEAGAPAGDLSTLPPPREWPEAGIWVLGEPDLIVRTQDFSMDAGRPDWWGEMSVIPVGNTEPRYVRAVAIREVNDIDSESGGGGVGGRFIIHHIIWSTQGDGGSTIWPVHEVGRNPDVFDPRAGRLLHANSRIMSNSVHLNAAGVNAIGRVEFGFYLHPPDYVPEYTRAVSVGTGLGDGLNIDVQPNQSGQMLHAYSVLQSHMKIESFEPHLHAPGARMCLEAIWGNLIETLSCSGYDHNWVKQYTYSDDAAPLLPAGTILHIYAEMDNTADNPNIPDPRNWQGSGNRSVSNMFIDLGNRVILSDEQFVKEMAERRERLGVGPNDHIVGCPLCMADIPPFEAAPSGEPAAAAPAVGAGGAAVLAAPAGAQGGGQ